MKRLLISIAGITCCSVLLSGCGAIMKPVIKAGFKALTKSGDEIVSGAAKGIGKNSDTFTKGITKNSESFYTNPSKSSWNQIDNQPSISSRPARIVGKEAVRNDQEQKHQQRIASLNQAIALKPSYSLYYSRGLLKAENLNDFEGALSDLNIAIRMDPLKDNAYIVRGNVKSSLDDYKGSISDFTKAININENNSLGFYNRGAVKAKYFKNRKSACLDFGKAAELGYAPAKRTFNNLDCNEFYKL